MKRLPACLLILCLVPAALSQDAATDDQRARRTPVVTAVGKVHDGVVNISTERIVGIRRGLGPSFGNGQDPFDRMFDEFFGGPVVERRRVQAPLGSGCIITPDGLVVTNEHVVRRATTIKLSLDDGRAFDADLLAMDSAKDIALLRAKSDKPLKAIPMGASDDLMLGETVIALGNPFGFENSVTAGIISAFNRDIAIGDGNDRIHYSGLIQTSALINPGNSGGPLVNILGELIGINTAVAGQAQGIGFAIPVGQVRETVAALLSAPAVSDGWSGIRGQTVEGRRGVEVTEIEPKSPAETRLQPKDVILAADGAPVRDLYDLLLCQVQHKPEDTIVLRIRRDGRERNISLTLSRVPQPSSDALLHARLGLAGQDMTAALAGQLNAGVKTGLLLSEVLPGGPAAKAGLERGDVILRLGDQAIRGVSDAAAALRNVRPGETIVVGIVRQNYRAFGRIELER